jgi:site-specific DNA recombinase
MKLRCAAYARYSSDRQSPASIADQMRTCGAHASHLGAEILHDYVFKDEAETASNEKRRPGLLALMSAASRTPRPFDVILVDHTSRLYRNVADALRAFKKLKFLGIRVIAVSQGIDSGDQQSDLLLTFHSLTDSMYLDALSKATHRGLQGRALQGFHTGGKCYGYDNVPVTGGGVRKQINPMQADVLNRIFRMSAGGLGIRLIAHALNREGVAPPRPQKGKCTSSWCQTAIREMLYRELYIGRQVWNASKWIRHPDSGNRLRRPRDNAAEICVVETPELRIIDQELWNQVHARIALMAERCLRTDRPGLIDRGFSSTYLLSGFLRCGCCGGNMIVTGRGKGKHAKYGCTVNVNRGTCANSLKQRVETVEETLFSGLQEAVLLPEAIDYVLQEFERQLEKALSGTITKVGQLRLRSEQIESEIANLINVCASGKGHSASIASAIDARELELENIKRQLLCGHPKSTSAEKARRREYVVDQIQNILALLKIDVPRAKAELAKHVSEIKMLPHSSGNYYSAEGDWNLLAGYASVPRDFGNVPMVAGARFELATFGL